MPVFILLSDLSSTALSVCCVNKSKSVCWQKKNWEKRVERKSGGGVGERLKEDGSRREVSFLR